MRDVIPASGVNNTNVPLWPQSGCRAQLSGGEKYTLLLIERFFISFGKARKTST